MQNQRLVVGIDVGASKTGKYQIHWMLPSLTVFYHSRAWNLNSGFLLRHGS